MVMPAKQPALLEARNVRIDEHGAPSIDGLSAETVGNHVIVLGASRALFEAACGMRDPARGELFLQGIPCRTALETGQVAGAPLDPPLPPKWTPRRYIEWSARLAGHPRTAARDHAAEAIAALELGALADAILRTAPLAVRRATVVAAAMATRARVLVLEDPMLSLPEPATSSVGAILARALRPHAWLLFATRAPLDAPLTLEADEALVLWGSRLLSQGRPELAARDGIYAVRIEGNAPGLARLLAARGARVEACGSELTVELGESLRTRDLLELANEVQSVIVELRPLSRAFA